MFTILVVEDNEMNRDILSRELRDHEYDVILAVDGEEGIQKAKDEQPDLILMDLSLPLIDGWEATRTIKSDNSTKQIPIIALTAHAMTGDREKALEAGCDDYETKPYEWDRLFKKIQQLLNTQSKSDEQATNDSQKQAAVAPAADQNTDVISEQQSRVEKTDSEKILSERTVLIVDDVETNRDLLARGIRDDGHHVLFATNGREALELLDREAVDIVLLDIMMPEVDGYEVLRQMKADTELRHVPVIIISASGEVANAVKCIEMGAEDYLPKPCDAILLKARVEACLERKRLRDLELQYRDQIEIEKQRADRLLKALFPQFVLTDLIADITYPPRRFNNVAVMFVDIVGFTTYCRGRLPEEIVIPLGELVNSFEQIAVAHRVAKIKTIGDSFMATAGLLDSVENPVLACINCANEMLKTAPQLPAQWNVRVGIHFGSVVAGIVGTTQYAFDLWGDTVNTAARIESYGIDGAINLSSDAWQQVDRHCRGESRAVETREGTLEIIRLKGFRR